MASSTVLFVDSYFVLWDNVVLIFPEYIGFHHQCVRLGPIRIISHDKIKYANILLREMPVKKEIGSMLEKTGRTTQMKCKSDPKRRIMRRKVRLKCPRLPGSQKKVQQYSGGFL